MSKIINLTQHNATPEQVQAGVFEPADKKAVQALLTFTAPPSEAEMKDRAERLAAIAHEAKADAAMIGGAPYFMRPLEEALRGASITPLYSFTERRATETTDPATGEVKKTQVFVHAGWVGAE